MGGCAFVEVLGSAGVVCWDSSAEGEVAETPLPLVGGMLKIGWFSGVEVLLMEYKSLLYQVGGKLLMGSRSPIVQVHIVLLWRTTATSVDVTPHQVVCPCSSLHDT